MIYACKRFVERYPNFAILLIGLWLVAAPAAFGVHLRDLTARNGALSGLDAWLELFAFSHKDYVTIVFATMLIVGGALIGFAIWRLVRRGKPRPSEGG
jgi:hypothetical protein